MVPDEVIEPMELWVTNRSIGLPEGIRTPDPRFRKPVLYPAELPGGVTLIFGAYSVLGRTDTALCV